MSTLGAATIMDWFLLYMMPIFDHAIAKSNSDAISIDSLLAFASSVIHFGITSTVYPLSIYPPPFYGPLLMPFRKYFPLTSLNLIIDSNII